jgi:hypothetical protein
MDFDVFSPRPATSGKTLGKSSMVMTGDGGKTRGDARGTDESFAAGGCDCSSRDAA